MLKTTGPDRKDAANAALAKKALKDGNVFYVNGRRVQTLDDVKAILSGTFE